MLQRREQRKLCLRPWQQQQPRRQPLLQAGLCLARCCCCHAVWTMWQRQTAEASEWSQGPLGQHWLWLALGLTCFQL